jgi:ankyrin repeat protein
MKTSVLRLAIMTALFGLTTARAAVPLIDAAAANQHAAAVAAIDAGADVKARDVDGTTALHWAVHNDDVALVARLLHDGADVAATNDYGSSPLQEAAVAADPAIIKLLLKAGANVDSPNAEGQTVLMVVARTGNVESAKLLLSHGAKINAIEQWGGQSALMWAAAQSQPEMVKLLVAKGADVNARSAVRDWQRRVTAEGRPKNMNHGGFTPLLFAAREGCVACVKALLKGRADINLQDPDGLTPLVLALTNMRFDLAAVLISSGADVNRWDFWGRTPLYSAVDLNTLPRGGRPDLPSTDSTTGLQIEEMLLKAGANPNIQLILRPPYRNGVFDRGGDQVISTGATPLLVAAKIGDTASIALLLKYHADINLPTATGVTPVMAAAGMGHSFNPTRGRFKTDDDAAASVKLLVDAGAKIDAHAMDGLTPLHAAAEHGWNDTVKLLVSDGAPLEPLDGKGLTPLDHAVGRHERAFLEPEHIRQETTIALLTKDIVAQTGRAPKEFAGSLNVQTRGTGGATGN